MPCKQDLILSREIRDRARCPRYRARRAAVTWFDRTLITDPENAAAHYNLSQIHTRLGNDSKKEIHAAHHARYKLDDNARDRAVTLHRSRNKPADHAAEAIVIRDLHRQGAFPVPEGN